MMISLTPGFIHAVYDIDGKFKSASGLRALDQFVDQRHAIEHDAFASACDMRKDAMLDWIII